MVNVPPISTTVIVRQLAHTEVTKPPLFSRILGFIPKAPMRPGRPGRPIRRATAGPRYRHAPALGFLIYAHRNPPSVYRPTTQTLGIRAGSWIVARLRHAITDTDSALVVLHVVSPVTGLNGTLPAGTRLLARIQAASANRVQLSVTQAITPDDRRIPLIAVVFDSRFQLGLPGFIEGGRRQAAVVAFGQSLLSSLENAFDMVSTQGSLASQTLGNAGRNTLGAVVRLRTVRRVLYIPAQRAYVQIQKGS